MKISDVIKQISDLVDTTPLNRTSGDNTSKFTAFTGDLTPVELPSEADEQLRKPEKMPSGNDAMPDDLYLPPLQLKSELLKKAVDVENVFDDGTPAVRYDEEYGEEGWHGDESEHEYIGAPDTAEQVEGQPDPNEGQSESADTNDRKRADETLDRMLSLANAPARKPVVEWGDSWDDDDEDVNRADRELARIGKAPIKAAVIDIDSDDDFDFDDEDDNEQLGEAKKELSRMKKLAGLNPVVFDELSDDNPV